MFYLLFILRLLKHIGILLFVSIPLQLIGIILLAIYLPIHFQLIKRGLRSSVKLPIFLRWYDNADQYIGRDTSTYLQVFGSGLYNLYCWLAFRNPLNYFGYKVLGLQILDENTSGTEHQTLGVSDLDQATLGALSVGDGYGDIDGFRFTEITTSGRTYYEYYWIKKFSFKGLLYCIRFRLGYKIKGIRFLEMNQYIQQVIVLQIKKYEGV